MQSASTAPLADSGAAPDFGAFASSSDPATAADPFSGQQSLFGSNEQVSSSRASQSLYSNGVEAAASPLGMTGFSDTSSIIPPEPEIPAPEPDCIRMWRAEFEQTIQDRDSKSETKHSETRKTAKEQLEKFYAEYNDKKEKTAKKLKDAESKSSFVPSSNFWVSCLCRP